MVNKQRIGWIDSLRGFCMLAILLDHTESYYLDYHIINQNIYLTDTLILFFILSGFLFYKKKEQNFNIVYKIKSIGRSLLMPYFIFTAIMSIPKTLVHEKNLNFWEITSNILLGHASWFIAALILVELLFAFSLWITCEKIMYMLPICLGTFVLSCCLPNREVCYFWQLDNALQAMLFLFIGYILHQYEELIFSLKKRKYLLLLLAMWIILKIWINHEQIIMSIWRIHISNYPIFIINILLSTLTFFSIFRVLPSCKWLEWTGRHCIVYYFLCGGIPLLVGKVFNHLHFAYQGNYLYVIVVFGVVYLCTSITTWFIYKYVPFITGQKTRNLKK